MDGGEPEEPSSSINTTDREYDTTSHDPQQQNVTSCIGLRPTAYPIYVTLLLLFVTNSINTTLVSESVIYNKVCYQTFTNLTLCTNTTFTRHHPLLQVRGLILVCNVNQLLLGIDRDLLITADSSHSCYNLTDCITH